MPAPGSPKSAAGYWRTTGSRPSWPCPRTSSTTPALPPTGDAGSGESEIRRWILENDWLEAIMALPTDLFYNTGIATYIWILDNAKRPDRKGKVQLIDATRMYAKMKKSLGSKRAYLNLDTGQRQATGPQG
ncbi:hypothetical protein C4901_09230 [Acidiferrobacter sp. SPIII_3]|nr:hypothetical protein C4901_09230 [Acidiferrobacter sp. SPIII_3]